MPITHYNESPYWDDFDQDKNYLRVLFRPGYSVQARELTQLQTAIQAQIERFGNHFFKDGTKVMGGMATINNKVAFVKVESNPQTVTFGGQVYSGNIDLYLQTTDGLAKDSNNEYVLIGKTLYGATSGLYAKIIDILPNLAAVGTTPAEPLVLYVEYTNSGGTGDTVGLIKAFAAEENILLLKYDPETHAVTNRIAFKAKTLESGSINPTGFGTRISIEEGVYYINGCFVHTPASSIIASRYRQNPWCRIVYQIVENKVTPITDLTLNDNALGTPNTGAPGAHRYQIALNLSVEDSNPAQYDSTAANFVVVMTVEDGKVNKQGRTEYTEIMKTMAQRTYEESGNYVLNPFNIDIREYLNTYTNGGLYSIAQIKNAVSGITTDNLATVYASTKLGVGLEPSVAYINGFRVELQSTAYAILKKARHYASLNNTFIDAGYGNYITVTGVNGLPDITTFGLVKLKKVSTSEAYATTTNDVGTARIRSIENAPGVAGTYRLYLFDITLNSGYNMTNVVQVRAASDIFYATVSNLGSINDAASTSLVYKLPYNVIKSVSDMTYSVRQKFTAITLTDGTSTNQDYLELNPAVDTQYFTSETPSDYIVQKSDGTLFYTAVSATIGVVSGQNYNKVTLYFASGTVAANTPVSVIASTQRSLVPKTKTFASNSTVAITSPNTIASADNYDSLGVVDVVAIKSIHMSPDLSTVATVTHPDISDRYILDNGQRDTYYDYSTLQLKAGVNPPTGRLLVVLDKFTHSTTGDYFAVSSYSNYETIPAFQSARGVIQLRDSLDFRPAISAFGYTAMSAPRPNITCDIEYYLGRVDKLCLDQYGNVKIKEGAPSLTPVAPPDILEALTMYTLNVAPYTFGPTDITAKIIDHRRYTMRDIGRIEKRVQKLEYYTALSLLEKETASKQILDTTGVDRYKNGFVVDSFTSHGIGAVSHPDYSVAVDKVNGLIRPMFYEDIVNLRLNTTLSQNYRQTGPLVTLNYYSAPIITQPFASYQQAVNPFATNAWIGKIQLYPGTDEWNENRIAPDVKVDAANGAYDSFKYFNDSQLATGTVWNYWETNWFGTDRNNGADTENITFSTGQSTSIRPTQNASSTELRTGTSIGLAPGTTEAYDSNRSVEVNVVPYIRSRKIYFKVSALKPNTKYYAFFDGVNVGQYVRQENIIPAYLLTCTGTSDAIDPTFINRSNSEFFQDYINYTAHPIGYTELRSNIFGEILGSFIIPNNAKLKFRAGKRIFTIVDIGSGDKRLASSYADSSYDTRGQFLERQLTVISTRLVQPAIQQIALEMTQPNAVESAAPAVAPIPAPPQPPGKYVVIDTDTGSNTSILPVIDDNAATPQPVEAIESISTSTTYIVPDNTVITCIPPSVGPIIVTSNTTTVSVVAIPPLPIVCKPPATDPTVTTSSTTLIPEQSQYGWYPIEAFEPYTTRSPYLIWSLPPQPRPSESMHEKAVKQGWYASEAYGQAPGGLVYGYPPSPNQSYTGVDTTNNTPVNTVTPNATTTTDITQESNTAIDIVGQAIAVSNPVNPTVSCIAPEEFVIDEINPTTINYTCWPGPLTDDTTTNNLYYVNPDFDTNFDGIQYTPKQDYFMSYDNKTIYTASNAQVSYESFDEEYTDEVESTLEA